MTTVTTILKNNTPAEELAKLADGIDRCSKLWKGRFVIPISLSLSTFRPARGKIPHLDAEQHKHFFAKGKRKHLLFFIIILFVGQLTCSRCMCRRSINAIANCNVGVNERGECRS